MCVNNEGCKHQHTNGQSFYEEPEVSIRFFYFFGGMVLFTQKYEILSSNLLWFLKKKNQAPVLVPKIRLNSDSE
jgi:hypothetical protein